MTEEKDELERVNMNWPPGLKDAVKAYAGPRGLTDFTVGAVERRLQDENRVQTLEKEVSELQYLAQLLADRYVMGGDHEDREAFLMEVDLPSWMSTAGWPPNLAQQVQKPIAPVVPAAPVSDARPDVGEHIPTPPPAPITGNFEADLDGPSGLSVDDDDQADEDLHKPMFMTGRPKVGKSPMPADPAILERMPAFEGKGVEFFERVQQAGAAKGLDISGANLRSASTLPQPEVVFHAGTGVALEGRCGATGSTTNDPGYVTCEDCKALLAEPVAQSEPVATPASTRALDAFEVDF